MITCRTWLLCCFLAVAVALTKGFVVRRHARHPRSPVCSELDIVSQTAQGSAIPGTDLPYCATEELQCCTVDFLNKEKTMLTAKMVNEIHQDILPTLMKWRQSYDASLTGLDQILTSFITVLPVPPDLKLMFSPYFAQTQQILKTQISDQGMSNLEFNFTEYVANITGTLVDIFTLDRIPNDQAKQMCADALLHEHMNITEIANVGRSFSKLQRVYHTLIHLRTFVDQLIADFNNVFQYTPSEQCLDALLSQYCGRCRQNIPTLCNSVCSAVLIGCQSPVQDGLKSQFDAVWNITRQLFSMAGELANQIICVDEPNILPNTAIISLNDRFISDCGIHNLLELLGIPTPGRRRRLAGDLLPAAIPMALQMIEDLEGTFPYSSTGPHFCTGESTVDNCWNGSVTRTADTANVSISLLLEEQENNPAYQFNTRGLKEQAIGLGYPVIDLIERKEYQQVKPAGLVTPKITTMVLPTPSATPTPSPSPSPSGSLSRTQHLNSLTILLISLILCIVLHTL